ncbi:hypothetical protein B0T18DRAFT_392377 [Schizothecium vesticola]|uniref:Uncharacterized protein n=1 Tax=Schizothecium vesticola TaxID=314040 RepID=A0AA40EQI3_9PEZI|nr:hypothetical protein B0T18DRAFT_392377 [Schizothecium vesticola]
MDSSSVWKDEAGYRAAAPEKPPKPFVQLHPIVLPPRKPSHDYKPAALRWPFLTGTAATLLVLIGVVAAACLALPSETDRSAISRVPTQATNTSSASSLSPRQAWSDWGLGGLDCQCDMPALFDTAACHKRRKRQARSDSIWPFQKDDGGIRNTKRAACLFGASSTPAALPVDPGLDEGKHADLGASLVSSAPQQVRTTTAEVAITTTPAPAAPSEPPVVLPVGGMDGVVISIPLPTSVTAVPLSVAPAPAPSPSPTPAPGPTQAPAPAPSPPPAPIPPPPQNPAPTTNLVRTRLEVEELVSVSATTSVSIVLNASGSPIATRTMLVISTVTPSYVTPSVISLTDERGVVTATSTVTPRPIMIPTVTTLTGPDGAETATVVTNVLATPRVVTYTDARGTPTTVTEYPTFPTGTAGPGRPAKVYQVSHGAYFVGLFLPTIITSLLTIPIRMIDMGAKQLQPWHELTRPNGATAAESLCLRTGGLFGIRSSIRAVMRGQGLIFLTTLLILCSVALVPLSAEAVALKVHGNCTDTDFRGCAMSLGVFLGPAKALIGLLVFMAVLVVAILVILSKWRSGVAANPWTIAGVSSLSMNEDFRALFASLPRGITGGIDRKRLLEAFEGKAFRLDYFTGENGTPEYGIVVQREVDGTGPRKPGIKESIYARMSRWETHRPRDGIESVRREHHLPFLMLSYRWRLVFLAFVTFLLVVVIYYARTNLDTPFERFMDAQDFGVTALFALVGITITFYWSAFFNSLTILSPYHALAQGPQSAERSLLLSSPPHAVAGMGIWSAIQRRQYFLAVVGLTSIVSEFMTILLSNVPFQITQTYAAHEACMWLTVTSLLLMWVVVVWSFFMTWPHMPVDPSTIAGAVFYVHDSKMLAGFEGLSVLPKDERDGRVCEMGAKYRFGTIVGESRGRRVGVDWVEYRGDMMDDVQYFI